jgi:hypothetical protein
MAYTEFFGLLALGWCLMPLFGWLNLRRATPAQRRYNRGWFRISLAWCVATVGQFLFHFIPPTLFQPSSWMVILEVIWVSLIVLVMLGLAINELRIVFLARNADDQRFPAGSDT